MNIDGTSARVALPQAIPGGGRMDMTITDAGVQRTPAAPRPAAPPKSAAQVASSPQLQDVLSLDETQALRDTFGLDDDAAQASGLPARTVYAFNGNLRTTASQRLGGVLDISG